MSAIDELYAEVYRQPDDDQLRRVLADALMAANDPRGELILFQLEPDKDYHRRAMRLIQQHGMSWLGPLRGVVIPLAYERGFLAACSVIDDNTTPCEEWATVHTIEVSRSRFVLHDQMRSLTTLRLESPLQLDRIGSQRHARLANVTIQISWTDDLRDILAKHLPAGLGKRLAIRNVPEEREGGLRAIGSPTVLDLHIAMPLVEDGEYYDDVDE